MFNNARPIPPPRDHRRLRASKGGPSPFTGAPRAFACALRSSAKQLEHLACIALSHISPQQSKDADASATSPRRGSVLSGLRPVCFASMSTGLRPGAGSSETGDGGHGGESSSSNPRRPEQEERILVSEVEVLGVDGELKELAEGALVTKPNFAYTLGEIQEDLNRVFATGYFVEIRPEPEDTRDGVKLSIIVKANPELKSIVSTGGDVLPQIVFEDAFRGLHGRTLNHNTFGDAIRKVVSWYEDAGVLSQVGGRIFGVVWYLFRFETTPA